jgi:hypothetical protein
MREKRFGHGEWRAGPERTEWSAAWRALLAEVTIAGLVEALTLRAPRRAGSRMSIVPRSSAQMKQVIDSETAPSGAALGLGVNAGEKMHRLAGQKMHHGRG